MVGAGEGVTGNKYIGARLGYRTGPFNVSAAVGNTAKTGAMLDDLTTTSLGASYKIGEATLIGGYEKAKYSTRDRTLINIGVKMTVGNGEISAQVAQTSGTGAPATPDQYDAKLFGMGYEHSLSKRTVLYATVGRIDNGGTSVTGGTLTTTGNGPSGMKRGETSSGYQFGMRHSF